MKSDGSKTLDFTCDQKADQPDAAPVDLVGPDPVVEGIFDVRCASRP